MANGVSVSNNPGGGRNPLSLARHVGNVSRPMFLFTLALSFIGYVATFMGISLVAPDSLRTFSNMVHILICIFLIIKFNPIVGDLQLDSTDVSLIFSTAVFLLINLLFTEYSLQIKTSITSIHDLTNPILGSVESAKDDFARKKSKLIEKA